MTKSLVRYQQTGDLHFVTFSCYRRQPHLGTATARDLFEQSLETIRLRYNFCVFGYVVMPEHVHLLVSEPRKIILAKADRKSTRLNSSHPSISYAVFCLKKKK